MRKLRYETGALIAMRLALRGTLSGAKVEDILENPPEETPWMACEARARDVDHDGLRRQQRSHGAGRSKRPAWPASGLSGPSARHRSSGVTTGSSSRRAASAPPAATTASRQEFITPYTPEQNGMIERFFRITQGGVRLAAQLRRLRRGADGDRRVDPLVQRASSPSGARLSEPASVQGSTTTGGGLRWGEHYTEPQKAQSISVVGVQATTDSKLLTSHLTVGIRGRRAFRENLDRPCREGRVTPPQARRRSCRAHPVRGFHSPTILAMLAMGFESSPSSTLGTANGLSRPGR